MPYSYYHIRERERSPAHVDAEPFFTRPLMRRNSKRQRVNIYDDDEYDDYPYSSSKPSKPSRALTIRQPTHIEKYNVWEPPSKNHSDRRYEDDRDSYRYKFKHTTYIDNEPEYEYKLKATYRRPSDSYSQRPMFWSGDMFRSRDKFERVDWEKKAREEEEDFWDDEPKVKESVTRMRKIKRSRTNEWRPLGGFKHF
ncbi:hypothetical protein CC78DRAFT_538716 [Lojkania enalia]|uniref:Uncharacterized protein n=1 Tax=Lojkania enalia TaxID=147567 RepID=A0A9P4NDD0_9PLEO|nr:hypothetical protein CC78DRAFT_538716 [Didymosphaeria enalia]